MDLFTYLMAKKGQNTQRDLFSYLLGKGAGGSGTYVNFTGTSLNISNTLKARIKNITLKGATSQYTTTGKNKLEIIPLTTKTINGVTFTPVYNGNRLEYIAINGTATSTAIYHLDSANADQADTFTNELPSGTYILDDFSGSSSLNIAIYFRYTTDGSTYTTLNSVSNTRRFTVDSSFKYTSYIRINNGTNVNNMKFYPQLENGSEETTYEEYTGGNPSPSPDYPQPIKVVTGDNSIVIPRNNLFNPLQTYPTGSLSQNCNIELTNLAQGQTYYFYANGKAYLYVKIYNKDGTLSRTVGSDNANSKKVNFALTSNETKIIGTFYAETHYDVSTYDWTNVYISTIDSYEPYNPQTYPLSLGNMELCSSPDKTLKDYIYGTPNNWYKYKFIQKTIFDGSENWSLSSLGAGKFYVQILPRFKVKSNPLGYKPYLTHFIGKINNDNFENGKALLYYTRTTDFLRLENDDTPTLAEWKAWLNDNNLTIYYLLNEPVSEQITDTTLIEQLNNLYNATSQNGTTYITCSSASDSNEIIVFSGDIKVTSVGNSLNTSLLSSNIQEEPNLDDVNETEDIEQNEEPIEEEVS